MTTYQICTYRCIPQILNDQGEEDGESLTRYAGEDIEDENKPEFPVLCRLQGVSLRESVSLQTITVILMSDVRCVVLDHALSSEYLLLGIEKPC